jgi:hypothetical protein
MHALHELEYDMLAASYCCMHNQWQLPILNVISYFLDPSDVLSLCCAPSVVSCFQGTFGKELSVYAPLHDDDMVFQKPPIIGWYHSSVNQKSLRL